MSHSPGLDELPTVIDGPGDYVTRDGRRASIHHVRIPEVPSDTPFGSAGAVWERSGSRERRGPHERWHVSGRKGFVRESATDIVGRWPDAPARR